MPVVSLSKILHLHCLELVQPRKTSLHDFKIVDWDVKHQPNQTNVYIGLLFRFQKMKLSRGGGGGGLFVPHCTESFKSHTTHILCQTLLSSSICGYMLLASIC